MKLKRIPAIAIPLLVVAAAGIWYTSTYHTPAPVETAQASKRLFTCGMHPQVIQEEPGNCPICRMKLTPMRRDPAADAGTKPKGDRKIKYWRAPMDPTYISDKPGKSPMGMDLVPVYEDEINDANAIAIDPVTIQNMAIRTMVLTNGPLRHTVRTVAAIEPDETSLADVTTKFMGWIEKLYVDATGTQVHKGDPLFEVYSPDLYSAQTEYLLATGGEATTHQNSPDIRSARLKLEYFDISDEQIDELEQTRRPKKTLRILAPIDGFVLEKSVVEGQMVSPGMKLYRIADLSLVWVQAQIYEQDLPYIKLGQEALVQLSYLPDRQFRGRVTYIYPDLDPKTRTVQVRMEFHNPGFFLKPGMFASVELTSELAPSVLLVPDMAVLRSGDKNTVFVTRPGGKFAPRKVRLGIRAENDMIQVLDGLRPGERIVTSGQFLLDSESQLREAVQKMLEPNAAKTATATGAMASGEMPQPAEKETSLPEVAGTVTYICPMPEHVSIEYEGPGECPICGMNLVPVSDAMLKQINPGGPVEYYTCPMPEHADVHLEKPGKCPRCQMTLIPVMQTPPPPPEPESTEISPPLAPLPTLYTCPMKSHAHVVSDQPGRCPECEMKLVETSSVEHGRIAEEHWRKNHPQTPAKSPDNGDEESQSSSSPRS